MKPHLLYIPAIQKNLNIKLSKKEIAKLPKTLVLAYSIQYKQLAESIKKQLKSSKIQIKAFKQVLGCTKLKTGLPILKSSKIQIKAFKQVLGCTKLKTGLPILLISTGKFHAQNLFLQTPATYFIENNKIIKIPEKEIKKLKAKKKTALIKFLKAEKIGILVSTKPGQENLGKALILKKKLESKNKTPFIFISNNIDINQFENFHIQSWVNTACPGLSMDNSDVINIDDLPKL